jgi:hypothetical protein
MPYTNEQFKARFDQLEEARKKRLLASLNDDEEIGPTFMDWMGLVIVVSLVGVGMFYLFGR